MIDKDELERWLATLPDDAGVSIDEGGLTLVSGEAFLEVGGLVE